MIDIESQIYTKLREAILTAYPKAEVSGKRLIKPSTFPAVSIIEEMNVTNTYTSDSEDVEQMSNIMIEVQIFSTAKTSKTECRSIMNICDTVMNGYNFKRIYGGPITNLLDTSVTRYVARYEATVDKNYNIYRR